MAHWGMEDVQACFGDTADLNTRQITVGGQRLGLLFLDGLTSGGDIAELVLRPLRENLRADGRQTLLEQAETGAVWCASVSRAKDAAAAAEAAAEKRNIKGPTHFNLVRRPFCRNMRVQRTSTGRRGGRPLRRVT